MGGGIYEILCVSTGKSYIGSAVNINRRFTKHRWELINNRHPNPHLQNAWNKHGENKFIFSVIELVDQPDCLLICEQKWFDLIHPEFNICKVAGSTLKVKHTEETKLKLAQANSDKAKKVAQLDAVTCQTIAVYDSLREAARRTKISRGSIWRVINSYQGRKIAGGYKWAFV